MGAQLLKYYDEAGKAGGMKAQMRLAMKTLISSDKAKKVQDSPENIEKFKTALDTILKEL